MSPESVVFVRLRSEIEASIGGACFTLGSGDSSVEGRESADMEGLGELFGHVGYIRVFVIIGISRSEPLNTFICFYSITLVVYLTILSQI